MTGEYPQILGANCRADGQTHFRVWAPHAQQVDLRIVEPESRAVPMRPTGDGYYQTTVDGLSPGALYFYRLNDTVDRPDPASRYQPQGVHGPSQITVSGFPWTDHDWRGLAWDDYVIYEAHVGCFTPAGTFAAMIEHLDELVDLGITALELMPVAQFPGDRNWGYDGVHPFAPQNTYGGPEGLKALVDACHARGLAVILDVVYNHLGPEGNYLQEFGPYFTDRYRTSWGSAINYDGADSDPVRAFFIANAIYWLDEFHVDGLRLDATHAIFDISARPFLRQLADAVRTCGQRLNRQVFAIAEHNGNDRRVVEPLERGGYGLDAQVLDDFQRSLHALVTQERRGFYSDFGRLDDFANAYCNGFALSGQYSHYRRRCHGVDAADLPADRFVVYSQNHDTVGNRPEGERLGRLVGLEVLKLAAAATILSPSIPMLFMGEEYDDPADFHFFISHLDPQLVESVRQGRVREFAAFDWQSTRLDPQAKETFERSRLTRQVPRSGHHAVLRKFYQELLRLRKASPAIRQSDRRCATLTLFESQRAMIVARNIETDTICLCYCFGDEPATIEIAPPENGSWKVLLDSSQTRWGGTSNTNAFSAGQVCRLHASPRSCILLSRVGTG